MRATVSFNDKYLNEILEWGPDIIHSQCEFFTFVFAKRLSKKLNIAEKVRESLKNYGINKEIEVIPTGINLDRFKTKMSEEEKMQLKKSLGLKEANKIILSVGRLGIEKNIDEILRNLPMLIEKLWWKRDTG